MYLSKTAFRVQPLFFYSMPVRSFAAAKEYDLAVIGGGPGGKTPKPHFTPTLGYVAAIKAG